MTTPNVKNGFSAAIIITSLVMISFLFAATGINNNHHKTYSTLKAVFKEPFRPLPIYGSNSINTRGPAWSDDAFRDSAASIGLKILRYPGGNFGDFWDWRKGWFIDSNTPISNNIQMPVGYGKMQYSPTGLKELKLLADKTNSDVLFELNMITSDVNDQIEMLKSAQELGFRIKWVELGNESNLPKSAGRMKFNTARDYGRACYDWIKAIKENFPGVEVGVVGGNLPYAPDVRNWNSTVLNEASNADAIIAHIYPFPQDVVDDDGIDFENLYNQFNHDFDKLGFNEVNNKQIWVNEYNIHWAYIKPGADVTAIQNNAFNWDEALAMLLMTSESTDLPGNPPLILNHSIANWRGFASVEKRKDGVYMLPNGIGYRAWCQACYNKNSLRQISLQSGNDEVKDFEVLGWQFKGDDGETSLLVNFTGKPVKIDITALNTGKTDYKLLYADKNKPITTWNDVTHERREIKNNEIELPPYSIATL